MMDTMLLAVRMREAHALCDEFGDVASASLDETEGRAWFLVETSQRA